MKAKELTEPILTVVHLAHQPPLVIHQVTLDPASIVNGENGLPPMIRLGKFPGDEANGWNYLDAIDIIHVLGKASYNAEKKELTVTPL